MPGGIEYFHDLVVGFTCKTAQPRAENNPHPRRNLRPLAYRPHRRLRPVE